MLDLSLYDNSLDKVLQRAQDHGVGHFLCVGVDLANLQAVLTIARQYPQVFASVGVHPNEVMDEEVSVDALMAYANDPKVVAIGETGLDYYRTAEGEAWQQNRFRTHIQVARLLKKPLIVHTRNAPADTIRILKEAQADAVGGVLHCFTEDWAMAKQALDLNFYISFSGIITFKKTVALQQVAKELPLNRILVETDAPYLAPEPFRGKPNEPAYVRYVAERLAQLRQVPFDAVAEQTSANFFRLFGKSIA
jgi:TatD DNase family protein